MILDKGIYYKYWYIGVSILEIYKIKCCYKFEYVWGKIWKEKCK